MEKRDTDRMARFNIPTDEQLRQHVLKDLTATGLTQKEYATRAGISHSGLQKFILRSRGATLEFARKLLGNR
jgi:predicted transcriptional regulator